MSLHEAREQISVNDRFDKITNEASFFLPEAQVAEQEPAKTTRHQKTAQVAGKIAAGLFMMAPVATGTATALHVAEQPAEVDFLFPGVAAEVSPQFTDYTSINYGPTLRLPAMHKSYLNDKLDIGVNLDIKYIDTNDANVDLKQIGTVVADSPEETIVEPIESAMLKQTGKGLGAGLVVGGFLGIAGRKLRRRSKNKAQENKDNLQLAKQVDNLPDLPYDIKVNNLAKLKVLENKEQKQSKRALPKALGGISLSLVLLAGSGTAIYDKTAGHDTPEVSTTPVNPMLTEGIPSLEGASLSGDVGHYTNQGMLAGLGFMKNIDRKWASYANSFSEKTLPKFKDEGGMYWQNNPNIKTIAHITDIHDNRSFMKSYLPAILKGLDVDVVVNSGDQMSHAGTSWLDRGAWERLAKSTSVKNQDGKEPQIVFTVGNHDIKNTRDARNLTYKTSDGTRYHPIIPLDESNNYTTTAEGITFVGAPDLNRTTSEGSVPSSIKDQLDNSAKQGELIADKACEIAKETGEKPIVIAHEREATYEAISKGCALLTLSGHLHSTLPTNAYINRDGSITYQNNLGSASGDGPNNATAIYNAPTARGAIRIWLYNTATHELVDKNITIYDYPNKRPTIKSEYLPKAEKAVQATKDHKVSKFLNEYRPELAHQQTNNLRNQQLVQRIEQRLSGKY